MKEVWLSRGGGHQSAPNTVVIGIPAKPMKNKKVIFLRKPDIKLESGNLSSKIEDKTVFNNYLKAFSG